MTELSEDPIDDATIEPGSAAWWSAHADRLSRRRPRAGGLTIERIVAEALRLIDERGLDALTVRTLAGRFDTSSATLYRHVSSVEDLLVLVVDEVLGEVTLPASSGDARRRVVSLAAEFRRVLLAHPNVVPALRAAPLLGPNALRGFESGLLAVLDLGFDPEVAVPGYVAMIDFVLGSVFFDTASAGRRHLDPDPAEHAPELAGVSSDAVFTAGIELLLDGMGAPGSGRR